MQPGRRGGGDLIRGAQFGQQLNLARDDEAAKLRGDPLDRRGAQLSSHGLDSQTGPAQVVQGGHKSELLELG
ncbi:hypothetical protein D9M70_495240 [compost metagenome]